MDSSGEKALIFNMQRFNVHDGAGIRNIVFFKGCPLDCAWCANPEGKMNMPQLMVKKELCIACGACAAACPNGAVSLGNAGVHVNREVCGVTGHCSRACPSGALELSGRYITVGEILREADKDAVFHKWSNGGLTLGGGEPLMQAGFCARLLREAKREGMDTAVETCGAVRWAEFEKVLPYVDTFLYDIKSMDSGLHRKYTGLPNEGILDNARRLSGRGAGMIIRTPVIPGVNDTKRNLEETALFAGELGAESLELLPYHPLGIHKYAMLGMKYLLDGTPVPSPEHMERHKAFAKQYFGRVDAGK